VFGVEFRRASSGGRYFQQLYGLVIKHAIYSLRNIGLTIAQIFIPVLLVLLFCVFTKVNFVSTTPPAMRLTLEHFEQQVFFLGNISQPLNSNDSQSLMTAYDVVAKEVAEVRIVEITNAQDLGRYLKGHTTFDDYLRHRIIAGKLKSLCIERPDVFDIFEPVSHWTTIYA
jgi:hypothetical protein